MRKALAMAGDNVPLSVDDKGAEIMVHEARANVHDKLLLPDLL